MAGSGANRQDDLFFELLSRRVRSRFPDLPLEKLEEAIWNGLEGRYNKEAYVSVNWITIWRWIRQLPEIKNAPGTPNNPKTVRNTREYLEAYGQLNEEEFAKSLTQ